MEFLDPTPTTAWHSHAEHWHGAAPQNFMVHTAVWEGDDVTWGDHVTDDEYGA